VGVRALPAALAVSARQEAQAGAGVPFSMRARYCYSVAFLSTTWRVAAVLATVWCLDNSTAANLAVQAATVGLFVMPAR